MEKKEKEKKQSKLILQRTVGGGGGGGGGARSEAVGRIWRTIMSQSILCNYFKVLTKFTLEGAE